MTTIAYDASVAGRLDAGKTRSFTATIRRWLAYRETVSELRELSPRLRADIGVDADVEDFAWRMSDR